MSKEGIIKETISVQKMPDYGYELRTEMNRINEDDTPLKMVSAYSLKGHYIGNPKDAYVLCRTIGIRPEPSKEDNHVCSIGFCKKEQKWYGWSHRALYGFGIGDIAKKGDCCVSSGYIDEYLEEHPEDDRRVPVGFEAKTLEDAKKMAIAFADSVS